MAPPNDQYQLQQLLAGINVMQAQQGLLPGGTGVSSMAASIYSQQLQAQANAQLEAQRAQFQQQIAPVYPGGMSPAARPFPIARQFMIAPPNFPQQQFGYRGAARQSAAATLNDDFAIAKSIMGIAPRVAAGVALTPLGGAAFEASGAGQAVQDFGGSLMNPLIASRQRMLEIQQSSMRYVGGGADMSAGGMGLSAQASQRLTNNLMTMASSRSFQAQTGGMFNREDVMKITKLSGELGMLDQSQTADQIRQQVGKISRSLANFMKIAEDPDVQHAMRTLSNMRNLGMSIPETNMAVQNARTFARMAGVSSSELMETSGMQGAGVFAQMGLSGATGMTAGMASAGMARAGVMGMTPTQQAMAGGRAGLEQTMTRAAASSATLDALLPAMLSRTGAGGGFAADKDAIRAMMTGRMDMSEMMRRSAANVRGPQDAEELITRRRELQTEVQRALGPMGQTLMPYIHAAMIQRTTGMGPMAAFRTMGRSEQDARSMTQTAQSPQFWQTIQKQAEASDIERGVERARAREEIYKRAGLQLPGVSTIRRGRIGIGAVADAITQTVAEIQDADEEKRVRGGAMIRSTSADPFSTAVSRDQNLRDVLRGSVRPTSTAMYAWMQAAERSREQMAYSAGAVGSAAKASALLAGPGMAPFALAPGLGALMTGPEGISPFEGGRGGEFAGDTAIRNMPFSQRLAASTFWRPPEAQLKELNRRAYRTAVTIERGVSMGLEEQTAISDRLRGTLGGSQERTTKAEVAAIRGIYTHVNRGSRVLGISSNQMSRAGLVHAIKTSMRKARMSEEDIARIVNDPQQIEMFISKASEGMDAFQRGSLENMTQKGAEGEEANKADMVGAIEDTRRILRANVLGGMGISQYSVGGWGLGGLSGLFGAGSVEEQTKLLDIMGTSNEAKGKAKRLFLAAAALRTQGAAGSEQAQTLMAQARRIAGPGHEGLRRGVEEQAGDTDALREFGKALVGTRKTGAQLEGYVEDLGQMQIASRSQDRNKGLVDVLGSEGAKAYFGGGITGLQQFNIRNPGVLSERVTDMLKSGSRANERILTAGAEESEKKYRGGAGLTTMGGISAMVAGAVANIRETFGTTPLTEEARAAAEAPSSFEEAVPLFSTASQKLLDAANKLSGEQSTTGILGTLMGGDTGITGIGRAMHNIISPAGLLQAGWNLWRAE